MEIERRDDGLTVIRKKVQGGEVLVTLREWRCETCKWWCASDGTVSELGQCDGPPSGYTLDGFSPPADFGCNQWEGK